MVIFMPGSLPSSPVCNYAVNKHRRGRNKTLLTLDNSPWRKNFISVILSNLLTDYLPQVTARWLLWAVLLARPRVIEETRLSQETIPGCWQKLKFPLLCCWQPKSSFVPFKFLIMSLFREAPGLITYKSITYKKEIAWSKKYYSLGIGNWNHFPPHIGKKKKKRFGPLSFSG